MYVSAFLMNPCLVTGGLIPFFFTIGVPPGLDIPLLEGFLLIPDSLDLVFFVIIGPVLDDVFFIGVELKIPQIS